MSRREPFFVLGSDRSGTTMFRLMLNMHSQLHVPPETWFLSDLMDMLPPQTTLDRAALKRALDVVTAHRRWKEWELSDADLRAAVAALEQPTLPTLIDTIFRLSSGTTPRWGDKTPGYVREISRLHGVFPNAKFIHVIRDARDVCVSLRQTGWRGDVTWAIATYWDEFVGAGCRQGRALPTELYLEIHYRDLVSDTETTLRRACEFLGEPFEPEMLEFHEQAESNVPEGAQKFHTKTRRPPRASDLDRWRRELTPFQTMTVEAGAYPTMRMVGQKLRYPIVARMLRPPFKLVGWIAEVSLPVRRRLGLHFPRLRGRF